MHIHVVAVSGTGMASLAGLLRELGHEVTGSDVAFDPPMGPALESWGVRCLRGFDAAHLDPRPDLVVVGNVCRKDNVEAVAAFGLGLRVTHIAGALREFALSNAKPLVVAGTHGKTTTTSMAAWLLDAAGLEPGFLVGGIPGNFDRSFRAARRRRLKAAGDPRGGKPPFVVEGDEYDTAYFEKTAKFLHYGADVAIVTSIEHDHVDIYPTLESYLEAFERFVAGIPESGLVVANANDRTVVDLVNRASRCRVSWYALEGVDAHGMAPHWMAAPSVTGPGGTTFDMYAGGVAAGRWVLPLGGRHNVSNALAAIGAVVEGYGVPVHALPRPLSEFRGVRRRQEVIGEPNGVVVIDDFAHHPTAVRETLAALRSRYGRARLFAVFEPRSATACRVMHQTEYESAFVDADFVLFPPLGRSGLAPEERLDLERLAARVGAAGKSARTFDTVDDIVESLVADLRPGDVVALLSNGAFGGIHGKLLSRLAASPAPAGS